MTSVHELHERAMSLAADMLAARARGQTHHADKLAADAFQAELDAARLAFDRNTSPATRLILLRSAANLAREARQWLPGIDLAVRALAAVDLSDYRTEVFRIVETLRTYEHLDVTGIHLEDGDVQLTIAGPDAAPDFARSDEVMNRVEQFRTLMIRSAMRGAGIPFAEGTPRTAHYRSVFTPYLSHSRAASFAVTLRFGIDEQQELALFETTDGAGKRKPPPVTKVLDDVMALAKAYAEGGPASLHKVIGDESYARNAAMLLRVMSPDVRRIATVGFTVIRHGKANPVALPERDAFDIAQMPWFAESGAAEALPPHTRTVVGRLLAGDAVKAERAHATVVDDSGDNIRFRYDEASHGDIIELYWKHRVSIHLRRLTHGYFLISIDNT